MVDKVHVYRNGLFNARVHTMCACLHMEDSFLLAMVSSAQQCIGCMYICTMKDSVLLKMIWNGMYIYVYVCVIYKTGWICMRQRDLEHSEHRISVPKCLVHSKKSKKEFYDGGVHY